MRMKHIITLCLTAWLAAMGVQAQTILLPTRKTNNSQQQNTQQNSQQNARQQNARQNTPQNARQNTQQQNAEQKDPERQGGQAGGVITLPTNRRSDNTPPVAGQTPANDSTGVVMGRALPVVRRQLAPRSKPIIAKPKAEDNQIYESAQHMPTYPGGVAELSKFISERLVYPEAALADSAQGIVQVSFIVEKNGTPSEFEVLDEHHPALEAEAVRVLQQMPRWNPATQNGVKVRVEYVVPVKFTLPVEKEEE